jgi:hypothetical protein
VTDSSDQLEKELEWLRGETVRSPMFPHRTPPPPDRWIKIARCVERVLRDNSCARLLAILHKHNAKLQADSLPSEKIRPLTSPELHRKKEPFLLAFQLFHIVDSVEMRSDTRKSIGLSERTAAELQSHLLNASTKSKMLAALLRKDIQPRIVLAAQPDDYELYQTFLPLRIIHSDGNSASLVPLDELLDKVARSLDSIANRITRAPQNRRPSKRPKKAQKEELRSRIAGRLVKILCERLGRPCHGHVAAIAHLMTGVPTDADYVKKVAKRGEH